MAKSGPKHETKTLRYEHLAKVARYDRMGWTQAEIAIETGVSQPQICNDLKKVRQQYIESMNEDRRILIAEKVAQLKDVRAEAWRAWEAAKAERRTTTREMMTVPVKAPEPPPHRRGQRPSQGPPDREGGKGRGKKLATLRVTSKVEAGLPGAEYLILVLKTLEAERELLGLDAPKEMRMAALVGGFDWAELTRQVMSGRTDEVERAIEVMARETEAAQLPPLPGPRLLGSDGRLKDSNGTNGHGEGR